MVEIPTEKIRQKEISFIASNFDFVKCKKIGKSVLNRDLISLSVGCEKRQVLWLGSFHGMEWITGAIILKFFKNLCYHIKNEEDYDILISLLNKIILQIKIVWLECNMEEEACKVSYKALGGMHYEN